MTESPETIKVQMVPMAEEDRLALRDAIEYLQSLHFLLGSDWRGADTIQGLQRIRDRIRDGYAQTYEIPMPLSYRTKEPLFRGARDE